MNRMNFMILVLAFLLVGSAVGQEKKDSVLLKGIGCLAAQDWIQDDLHGLGLSTGKIAAVRYRMGTIPGTSPETPDVMNVIVYSPKQTHAWMLFFRQNQDGSISAIRNAYRLVRSSKGWDAGEGNGGVATYKAIGAFAMDIAKEPVHRVKLTPNPKGCQAETATRTDTVNTKGGNLQVSLPILNPSH